MYYTVYRVTNKISGKFYIGTHKTADLDDNYMGSGKYLNHSIEKHGIENFTKEILFIYDNPEEMYAKESEIVNEDFLAEENTYNLKVGGFGSWDYVNKHGKNIYESHEKQCIKNLKHAHDKIKILRDDKDWVDFHSQTIKAGILEYYNKGGVNGFAGKCHSDETKKKIGKSNSEKQSGELNSQYGKKWIYSPSEKKSIKINRYDDIPQGWLEGRKIKF